MNGLIFKTKRLFLFAGDIIGLYLALYLTLVARNWGELAPESWLAHTQAFSVIFILWLIVFYINDLYDLKGSYNNANLLRELSKSLIISGIIAVLAFYFLTPFFPSIKPQRVLIIDLFFSFAILFAWRKVFYGFLKSSQIANKVLILGRHALTDELAKAVELRPQLGYKMERLDVAPENLKQYCSDNQIDILVTTENFNIDSETARKIFDCLSLGLDIYKIEAFYELITQKIPVEHIEVGWFLENLTENSKKSYEIFKRLLDLVLAFIGLVLTAPLVPLIALIIKLESRGPVIFKQIRVGRDGNEFLAMKFRSMVADAEKNGAQWATKNDPRVTRFGRLMRKTRLDEIPQLINILRGEMSLIGPRPERPEFVEMLAKEIPFYRERLLINPGLTGWAQLLGPSYGGSKEESLEKLKFDLYYIKNRSLMLDLSIILKTLRVVLGGKGQ